MLRKVDPLNLVLVNYLTTINPDVETVKFLDKTTESSSKKKSGSKKEAEPIPLIVVPIEKEAKSPKMVIIKVKSSKKKSKPIVTKMLIL